MRAGIQDAPELAELVKIVWPEHSREELRDILEEYMDGKDSAVFAEKDAERFAGVALACLRRDYVEGCDTSPVGYLEGIAVREDCRGTGVARRLTEECEQWARDRGCTEFASDCELTNTASLRFHLSLGFEETNRIIHFRKDL